MLHLIEVITFCDNHRFSFFGSYLLCHIDLNRLCLFLATKLQNSSRIIFGYANYLPFRGSFLCFFVGIASFRRVLRSIYANRHFYLAFWWKRALKSTSYNPSLRDYQWQSVSTFGDAETRGCVFPMCSRGKKKKELDFSNSLIFKRFRMGLNQRPPD